MLLKKEVKENSNFLLNFSLVVLLVSGSVYILYIWQSLIVPFIISILFSLAILWLSNLYKKIHIPSWIAFSLSVMSYFLIFYFIWLIIISNINDLILDAPTYQARITELIQKVEKIILPEWSKIDFSSIFSSINFQSVFNYILSAVTSISSSIWTILFYTIFILLESLYFEKKLKLMVSDDEKRRKFTNILSKIEKDVKWYFFIKTFISLLTALLCNNAFFLIKICCLLGFGYICFELYSKYLIYNCSCLSFNFFFCASWFYDVHKFDNDFTFDNCSTYCLKCCWAKNDVK